MVDPAITTFLTTCGYASSQVQPLAGDASTRAYFRIQSPPAILMDARKAPLKDLQAFVVRSNWLKAADLRVPRVLAQDLEKGFLLLEDLGDALFARVLERDHALEKRLYLAATEVLFKFEAVKTLPCTDCYDSGMMGYLAGLATQWYAQGSKGAHQELVNATKAALAPFDHDATVFVHRDYHAENLIWLTDELGTDRVGIIDYQDGLTGHPTYDLASLLQDVRRDVSQETAEAAWASFSERSALSEEHAEAAYVAMGAQRALRILGVFARLSLHYGKPKYVGLIPKTWEVLFKNLSHPSLARLKTAIESTLPEPTPARLQNLRDLCGTVPQA